MCNDFGKCTHKEQIQLYYDRVISAMKTAANVCIPVKRKHGVNKPGWDEEIKDAKKKARRAFQRWRLLGKPRQGMEFDEMVKTRKCCKRALKSWRKKKDTIFGRKSAENLENGSHVNFCRTLNRGASNESQARFCSCKIGQACIVSDILNLCMERPF